MGITLTKEEAEEPEKAADHLAINTVRIGGRNEISRSYSYRFYPQNRKPLDHKKQNGYPELIYSFNSLDTRLNASSP